LNTQSDGAERLLQEAKDLMQATADAEARAVAAEAETSAMMKRVQKAEAVPAALDAQISTLTQELGRVRGEASELDELCERRTLMVDRLQVRLREAMGTSGDEGRHGHSSDEIGGEIGRLKAALESTTLQLETARAKAARAEALEYELDLANAQLAEQVVSRGQAEDRGRRGRADVYDDARPSRPSSYPNTDTSKHESGARSIHRTHDSKTNHSLSSSRSIHDRHDGGEFGPPG
jgi:chromosome segregation ATPase